MTSSTQTIQVEQQNLSLLSRTLRHSEFIAMTTEAQQQTLREVMPLLKSKNLLRVDKNRLVLLVRLLAKEDVGFTEEIEEILGFWDVVPF